MSVSPPRMRLIGVVLAVLVLVLDQLSKMLLLNAAQTGTLPVVVLPFFRLVLVHNTGISFGLLAHLPPDAAAWMPLVIMLATSLIALVLLVWLLRARVWHVILALALIIGGAAGNIVDRARFGSVVDFLDFCMGMYHWPAFNLADSAIFMGVVILVFMGIVTPQPKGQ